MDGLFFWPSHHEVSPLCTFAYIQMNQTCPSCVWLVVLILQAVLSSFHPSLVFYLDLFLFWWFTSVALTDIQQFLFMPVKIFAKSFSFLSSEYPGLNVFPWEQIRGDRAECFCKQMNLMSMFRVWDALCMPSFYSLSISFSLVSSLNLCSLLWAVKRKPN